MLCLKGLVATVAHLQISEQKYSQNPNFAAGYYIVILCLPNISVSWLSSTMKLLAALGFGFKDTTLP